MALCWARLYFFIIIVIVLFMFILLFFSVLAGVVPQAVRRSPPLRSGLGVRMFFSHVQACHESATCALAMRSEFSATRGKSADTSTEEQGAGPSALDPPEAAERRECVHRGARETADSEKPRDARRASLCVLSLTASAHTRAPAPGGLAQDAMPKSLALAASVRGA